MTDSPQSPMLKPDILALDNTMIKDYMVCPRFFYWRHIRGYKPRGFSLPLLFGSAIHAGLEAYYLGKPEEECYLAFGQVWGDAEGDDKRSLENGLAILGFYFSHYPRENEPWEVLSVERALDIVIGEINGVPVHYTMKMDLVVRDTKQKGVLVIDHKTASRISDVYLASANPNRQFTGYIIGAAELWEDVIGAMLNAILVSKSSQMCARQVTQRGQTSWATWVDETLYIINRILASSKDNCWPQGTEWCTKWNRKCEFHDLCTGTPWPKEYKGLGEARIDPVYRVLVPESQFDLEFWNPYKVEEGGES